jgi:signal transduction histidine kinase/CHASE2 domain-containing sensor protein
LLYIFLMSNNFRTGLILLLSSALVVLVTWFTPNLSAAALNLLFRLRGPLAPPADVVLVAIDEQSLRRFGQWPWSRAVMATALDKLTAARARSVGLDIIYAEPATTTEDQQLAAALARNGRVVLPAQLYETATGTAWLRPLPAFAAAARSLGHAHVAPGVDGMARSVQLSKADDRADRFWAFALETVRVAEQIPVEGVMEQRGFLQLGQYRVPVTDEAAPATTPGVTIIRPNETLINYAGPAQSFTHYSFSALLEDKIPRAAFTDKLVLIGATAPSLGDTRIVPFMHYGAGEGGQEMPGVEIHANIINTLRGGLALRAWPDWLNFAAALLVLGACALIIRWLDGWRQIALLGVLLLLLLGGSFLAFSRAQLIPPLVPMLAGFAVVLPLLLNRALAASRELDRKLAALVAEVGQDGILSPAQQALAKVGQDTILSHTLPHSLDWKLRAVDDLTTQLLARMSFINRVLASMGEGVLVADLAGRVIFANHEAAQLLGVAALSGAELVVLLNKRSGLPLDKLREALRQAARGQQAQLELTMSGAEPRHCLLLLSPLGAQASLPALPGVIGVVALLSDITKRVELERMKTETLQLVSHELRTPLTSIQGLSDVLLKFPVAKEESRELLSTIHAEAVRLGETINRYLDLTRLESGAQPLRLAPVDWRELIADCLRQVAVLAAERRITFATQIAADLPTLAADAQLLMQALNNLLSNAIKYSPPETTVLVTAAQYGDSLALSVRDQGYGIPAEARTRIFEKFYRLERDAAAHIVGTGLGLPLVKEIVERHGGRITCENNSSPGSTFTLHLPVQP